MKLEPMLMLVDVGYSVDDVANIYVKAFNKSGGSYIILDHHTRNPIQDEIVEATRYADRMNGRLVREGEDFFVSTPQFQFDNRISSGEVKKKIFVLVITKMQETPAHIMAMRPKIDPPDRIEVKPERDES